MAPYDNKVVIFHEGASGGGKSEMLEQAHRQADGSLMLGLNTVTGEKRFVTLPRTCVLRPVTDDVALCHPSLDKGRGKLSLMDAELRHHRNLPRASTPARCPLLGHALKPLMVGGGQIGPWFLEVDKQTEVGEAAHDAGAEILGEFFHRELRKFLDDDLDALGRTIIGCCLSNETLSDYQNLLDMETLAERESVATSLIRSPQAASSKGAAFFAALSFCRAASRNPSRSPSRLKVEPARHTIDVQHLSREMRSRRQFALHPLEVHLA